MNLNHKDAMMHATIKTSFFFLIVAIMSTLFTGCAATSVENIRPIQLLSKPTVTIYKDPDAKTTGYRTFSVFPQSPVSEKTGMNEILEKQVLFFLRSLIESGGYRFVALNQHPDFLVTISVLSKYETSYVPPQIVTVPKWMPGQTIQSYGTYYDWNGNSGSLSSTTYLPGYATTETYTQPGYTVGAYYPSVAISFYDGKTRERICYGVGAGRSNNPDVRVSSQFIVTTIFTKLTDVVVPSYRPQSTDGVIGVDVAVLTNDGNNYLPTIGVISNSPAQKAGLRDYDMIVAINGVSVINKSWSEVRDLLLGAPGTTLRLEVWRAGQRVPFEVTRTTRDQITSRYLLEKLTGNGYVLMFN